MTAAPATLDNPTANAWNWRADLATLDAALAHVAEGATWDWRSEIAAIDAGLDSLAAKLGL